MNTAEHQSQLKFLHAPGHKKKGGVTLVYKLIKHSKGKRIKFAAGFCSKQDFYCRKLGRDAALKQWTEGNTLEVITKKPLNKAEEDLYLLALDLRYLFDNRI